jgi:hypothetical protein
MVPRLYLWKRCPTTHPDSCLQVSLAGFVGCMPLPIKRNKRLPRRALLFTDDASCKKIQLMGRHHVHGVLRCGLLKPIFSDFLP